MYGTTLHPFFVSVRKARNYITYAEDGDWPSDEYAMPTVLAICQDDKIRQKLSRQIRRAFDEKYITDEIAFAITTLGQFRAVTAKSKLWHKVTEDGEVARMGL